MNGKQKGGQFERDVCRRLSHWVSRGKQSDLFWRSAMSGGRATVARNKGESVRQAGDITAVALEGHVLTDRFYIECKFYKDLDLIGFVLRNRGKLAQFWKETKREAEKHDCREPMLIAKQNHMPALLIVANDYGWAASRFVSISDDSDTHVYQFEDIITKNARYWK